LHDCSHADELITTGKNNRVSHVHQIKAYLSHWLHVVDEHSVHSPFFFDFYINVLKKQEVHGLREIEGLRDKLLTNTSEIEVTDLGGGSAHFNSSRRMLSQIASTGLTPREFCSFYFRILQFLEAKRIIELGTSLGITTLYLASRKEAKIFTFEGSHSVADIALTNFEYFNTKNIELIEGNIDTTLPDFLQNPAKINFALIDANHRYEPTIRYFNLLSKRMADKGIVVIDDIHHTPDMERAWNELKKNDLVYASVDLFRCGLLFFDPALNKQHFIWSLT
jgi:predicted O-methyltransferase YrrM